MSLDIDVITHIGAVARVVETRERDGRLARVVRAGRRYDTAIDDLWDAVTSAERIPRWFMPISGDLRLGGRYQLQGNAGGEITRCEPPRFLAVTWEYGGDVSWLEVTLAEEDGGTRLELVHTAHVPDEFWDQYGPGAVGVGWDQGLVGLARYLETGQAVDPAAAMAWVASDEGRDFVRRSSEGWCRASIAGGTDPDAALAAATRTTAFYTGVDGGSSSGDAPAS
jgi:uncharacterized protein YndB with AHSA1/START domain